jgi:hypothetical protein
MSAVALHWRGHLDRAARQLLRWKRRSLCYVAVCRATAIHEPAYDPFQPENPALISELWLDPNQILSSFHGRLEKRYFACRPRMSIFFFAHVAHLLG